MTVSRWQLNSFERFLFGLALVLAALLLLVRLAAVLVVWYLQHRG